MGTKNCKCSETRGCRHSNLPVDIVPYIGAKQCYCYLDYVVNYEVIDNRINLAPRPVVTRADHYVAEMQRLYNYTDYRLLCFAPMPNWTRVVHKSQDWEKPCLYMAILSKSTGVKLGHIDGKRKLLITDFAFEVNCLGQQVDRSTLGHQFDKQIETMVRLHNCRLVAGFAVGRLQAKPGNPYPKSATGCQLIFEKESKKSRKRDRKKRNKSLDESEEIVGDCEYVYHTATIAAHYFSTLTGSHRCTLDWNVHVVPQLAEFLNKGWRLVDIVMDLSQFDNRMRKEFDGLSFWIFEKRRKFVDDMEPRYEGTVVEFFYRMKMQVRKKEDNFDEEFKKTRDLRSLVAAMGVSGWKLSSVVQTPDISQCGVFTCAMRLLLVFQRRIHDRFERLKKLHDTSKDEFSNIKRRREIFQEIYGSCDTILQQSTESLF